MRKSPIHKGLLGWIACLLLFASVSCIHPSQRKAKHTTPVAVPNLQVYTDTLQQQLLAERLFPLPAIPGRITDPLDRTRYLSKHYWDPWTETDTIAEEKSLALEQTVVDFLSILQSLPDSISVQEELLLPLQKARGPVLQQLLSIYRKYLQEPASPFHSEEMWLRTARWGVQSNTLSYAQQVRLQSEVRLLSRNLPGTPAQDFNFVTASAPDSVLTLTQFGQSKELILFFYTPGCDLCKQSLTQLQYCTPLKQYLAENKMALLLVYNGYNKEEWLQTLSQLPPLGTPAFNTDSAILDKQLYDLDQTPTILWLEKKGIVKYKNISTHKLIEHLYDTRKTR